MNNKNMYMCYYEDYAHEEAILVFADNSTSAKHIAYYDLQLEGMRADVCADKIEAKHLRELATSTASHSVCPPVCDTCETWGVSDLVGGLCEVCR